MSASISVQTKHGHFDNARAGMAAVAKAMRSKPEELGLLVNSEMKKFLKSSLTELAKRHSKPHPGGTTSDSLSRRSGELVRRLPNSAKVSGKKSISSVVGRVGLPKKYAIQERGGTIKPSGSKFVFIPLPDALDASGKPKKPKSFKNTFMSESRRGNLMIFQKRGREIVPLYVLRKSVKIPPRMGMGKELKRGIPAFVDGVMSRTIDQFANAT